MFKAKPARSGVASSRDAASGGRRAGELAPGSRDLRSDGAADAVALARPGDAADRDAGERPASADGDADSSAGADVRGPRGHRADLRSDTIEVLRAQHRRLKVAARDAQREMRNAKRRRNRVLTRLRNLDTASVLAVLMDRVANPGEAPAQLEAALGNAARAGVAPDQVARGLLAGRSDGGGDLPDSEPRSPADSEDGDDASDQPRVAEDVEEPAPAEASEARCITLQPAAPPQHDGSGTAL